MPAPLLIIPDGHGGIDAEFHGGLSPWHFDEELYPWYGASIPGRVASSRDSHIRLIQRNINFEPQLLETQA